MIGLRNGTNPGGFLKYVLYSSSAAADITEYDTNSGTVVGHANAKSAIAVGATDYRFTPDFGVSPAALESYSSVGQVNILFDTSGNRLSVPDARSGVAIVAPDGGNTTFFDPFLNAPDPEADGRPNFYGTSAAAPHAAALAALLLQADPSLTPDGIEATLKESAVDMDNPYTLGADPGPDAATGYGFVDALGAIGVIRDSPQLKNLAPNQYILVNTTNDTTSISGSVSLRGAVINANGAGTQKTILVPGGTYGLNLNGTLGDTQGDLDITNNVKIIGAGPGTTIIDAAPMRMTNSDRVFDVMSGATLNLDYVTVKGGRAPATAGEHNGGGIDVRNGGTLQMNHSVVVGNEAWSTDSNGAGIYFDAAGTGYLRNSVVTNNSAVGQTSGVYLATASPGAGGNVEVTNTIIGLNIDGSQNLSNRDAYAAANRTFTSGGNNRLTLSANGYGFVGGLIGDFLSTSVSYIVTGIADTLHVDDSIVRSLRDAVDTANSTAGPQEIWLPGWRKFLLTFGTGGASQGDFDIAESTVTIRGIGAGDTIIDATPLRTTPYSDRLFDVLAGTTLNLSSVTLTGGRAGAGAGELNGGAIYVRAGGKLNLSNAALVGNQSFFGAGGGVYFDDTASGSIANSVVASNVGASLGSGVVLASGTGVVTVSNTIIAKNVGTSADVYAGGTRLFTTGGNNRLTTGGYGFTNGASGDYVSSSVNYIVTSASDRRKAADDNVAFTLREAIVLANGTVGAQEVWVPGWQFLMTIAGLSDTDGSQGDFDVAETATLRGVGAGETIIDASPLRLASSDRVFDVKSGATFNLNDVTLTGGRAANAVNELHGGAIYVRGGGTLNLFNSAIVGNQTFSGAGASIYFDNGAGGSITKSVITSNTAASLAGGVALADGSGSVTVGNSIIAKNFVGSSITDVYAGSGRTFSSGGNNRLTTGGYGFTGAGDYVAPTGTVINVVTGLTDTYNRADDEVVRSVRDAIDAANGSSGAEEVWLPAGNFVLTRERNFATQLTDMDVSFGDLDISDTLTIRGVSGSTSVAWRAGSAADAVFDLLGDYNGDGISSSDNGVVDSGDYAIWAATNGSTTNLQADGNDDGVINSLDYDVWRSHFGNTLTLL